MKVKRIISILTMMSAMALCFCLLPSESHAVSETGRTDYTLMKGVTESTVYVTDNVGRNVRAHILRINNGANVSIKASSKTYYKKKTKSARKSYAKNWTKKKWGYATVGAQAKTYNKTKDRKGTVIAAANGDFYKKGSDNGKTVGPLIMEGNKVRSSSKEPYFAVMKSGAYTIRSAGSSTKDVREAIGGGGWLVKKGEIVNTNGGRDTITAIGVTENKDVVIVTVDGREASSTGTSMNSMAWLMRQQGCVSAIYLDCGGSASFLTKRKGNSSLVMRNVANDGAPRPVSSAILIVKNKKASKQKVTGDAVVSMKDSKTKLKKSGGVWQYTIDGTKQKGFFTINGIPYLFDSNGKGQSKTVKIGNDKFTFSKGKLSKVNGKSPGRVALGYCGASNNGKNLIYMYRYSSGKLNIGKNPRITSTGKMANWASCTDTPWQAEKYKIKAVAVGSGVKNLGDHFLHIPRFTFNQKMKTAKTSLTTVKLSSTLTRIGCDAFAYHSKLKTVNVPSNVTYVGARAFGYERAKITVKFKGSNPPKFGEKAFIKNKGGKQARLKVPGTKAWKKYLKSPANRSKIKFSGTVTYY